MTDYTSCGSGHLGCDAVILTTSAANAAAKAFYNVVGTLNIICQLYNVLFYLMPSSLTSSLTVRVSFFQIALNILFLFNHQLIGIFMIGSILILARPETR